MQPRAPGPHAHRAAAACPDEFPYASRACSRYLLFDATGIVYLLVGFVALRVAVGARQRPGGVARAAAASSASPVYDRLPRRSRSPASLFVGVRFFRLFPKAQPAQIGPAKPPPRPVIHAMLYAAWIGVTLVLASILAGGLF